MKASIMFCKSEPIAFLGVSARNKKEIEKLREFVRRLSDGNRVLLSIAKNERRTHYSFTFKLNKILSYEEIEKQIGS